MAALLLAAWLVWPGVPGQPPCPYQPPACSQFYFQPPPYLEWWQRREWGDGWREEQRSFQQQLLDELREDGD